jgi:hypothetical protein
MGSGSSPDITRLLQAWGSGDPLALERLVYEELRRIARCHDRASLLMTFSALLSREPRRIQGKLNVYYDFAGIAGARELSQTSSFLIIRDNSGRLGTGIGMPLHWIGMPLH